VRVEGSSLVANDHRHCSRGSSAEVSGTLKFDSAFASRKPQPEGNSSAFVGSSWLLTPSPSNPLRTDVAVTNKFIAASSLPL
jgi:hypothetical protein